MELHGYNMGKIASSNGIYGKIRKFVNNLNMFLRSMISRKIPIPESELGKIL